jgi:hypothetical protein
MTMPTMPGTGFVMVEANFVLGCFQTFFDRPPCSLYADQSID